MSGKNTIFILDICFIPISGSSLISDIKTRKKTLKIKIMWEYGVRLQTPKPAGNIQRMAVNSSNRFSTALLNIMMLNEEHIIEHGSGEQVTWISPWHLKLWLHVVYMCMFLQSYRKEDCRFLARTLCRLTNLSQSITLFAIPVINSTIQDRLQILLTADDDCK